MLDPLNSKFVPTYFSKYVIKVGMSMIDRSYERKKTA